MASSKEKQQRTLIGTIGYHNLGNHSIGPLLFSMLAAMDWPEHVQVEEMNWGPIAIVQSFQALERPYEKVILLAAMQKPGRNIGDITVFKWIGDQLPDTAEIQARVGDAVTGVISLDNLLVIGEYFKIWPQEVYVVDVEPGPEKAGTGLTEEVATAVPDVIRQLKTIADGHPVHQGKIEYLYGDKLSIM